MAQALVHMSCGRLRSAITTGGDATGGLQKILAALVAIQPLLEDAERKSVRIAVVEHPGEPGKQQETYMSFDRIGKGLVWAWLKRVTNVAYDIIDMVNELEDTRPRDAGKVYVSFSFTPSLIVLLAGQHVRYICSQNFASQ